MAEERKSITLYIAQQPFKLSMPVSEEELYRQTESRMMDYMKAFAEKTGVSDRFTLLGYAAINFALNETRLNNKQKFVDTDLKNNLRKIQEVIQMVLSDTKE